MLLLARNAFLTKIATPPVPADPGKNIPGAGAVTRWSGNTDAYIDEDVANTVRLGSLVGGSHASGGLESAGNTVIHVPANLPVWPNLEDLVTIKRLDVLSPGAGNAVPSIQTFKVRMIDTGVVQQGRLILHVVLS